VSQSKQAITQKGCTYLVRMKNRLKRIFLVDVPISWWCLTSQVLSSLKTASLAPVTEGFDDFFLGTVTAEPSVSSSILT
jgi:hypothetical protein